MVSTAAMPSSSALCASMGPLMQSPMAQIEGTWVRKCSSTSTRPCLSSARPMSSSPRPLVNGRRPVATSTTSVSMVSASPPEAGSMVTLTPLSETSVPVTLVFILKLRPCFLRTRSKPLMSSLSMPGQSESMNSTTVTSAPRRLQTEAISRPITPPPTTTMLLGTLSRSSTPVESTMRRLSLSTGQGGSGVGSDPVAMRMFFALTLWLPPPFRETATSLAPMILPQPLTQSTLFFLKRPSIPVQRPSTTERLWLMSASISMLTVPSILMPCWENSCCAAW
mmetsp:Transcript_8134/g.20721  ORF Transcript_8134/g.20721 Transcript_8134/m.20721 type:complete len:280 (+) Transcript_8134:513-1352(+)